LGTNNITLTLTVATGETATCNAVITVEPGDVLPGGWSATDIGTSSGGNDYSFDPCTTNTNGEFVITGSGNNATSSTTDNVAFAGQTLCGDGTITAKVESVTPNGYGGLMIRESTNAGAKSVAVFSNLSSILRHETRYATNGPKQVNSFFKPSPTWLRLQRMGNWVFAYYSTTGMPGTFQYVHGVFVSMQNCVEIGLASFTYLPGAQTDATFSNVSIMGNTGGLSINEPAGVTETDKLALQGAIRIYPNPGQGNLTVQFDQPLDRASQMTLYNTLGQLLETKQIVAGTNFVEWHLDYLPSGAYWIQVQGRDKLLPLVIQQ
jgi:hypothetical protein